MVAPSLHKTFLDCTCNSKFCIFLLKTREKNYPVKCFYGFFLFVNYRNLTKFVVRSTNEGGSKQIGVECHPRCVKQHALVADSYPHVTQSLFALVIEMRN